MASWIITLAITLSFRGKDLLPRTASSKDGFLCSPSREREHAKQEATLLQNGRLCSSEGKLADQVCVATSLSSCVCILLTRLLP